ncbi:NADH-dependent flavin oxidoreductase [Paenibacillus macerans]|uniref:NADH-dependent flavin oxidoreductase n=1 Tax=Paenibacillus macerans TaxID=44252 RepID=UPI002DBB4959|nr:NADH-dependent flavin oxidoreductase [Paenibacillus macerans]MEC0329283.1 NADH-dependent flavin oxidoreductase [Paenibacillus macerans]
MKERYVPLFEPFTLKNGLRIKNRVVMPPMAHSGSLPGGFISDEELSYYARRVKDVGMAITSATTVLAGAGYPGMPGAESDEHIPGLQRLAQTLKADGAKAILQLFHIGARGSRNTVSASAVAPDAPGAPVPRELSEEEIHAIIKAFGDAARRAIAAGFDGVEIMGANGYLIHQFFSPYYNRRNDKWGGTLEKRMAFPLAIIKEVTRIARTYGDPSFVVGYKFSPEERETPGITMADTMKFVDVLADQDLDYLNVSLVRFWSVPRRGTEDKRPRIEIIKSITGDRIPLLGAGELRTPEDAAAARQTGVEFIGIGRALLMDPDWLEKARLGKEEEIRTELSRHDQEKLKIPGGLWSQITRYIDFID